MAKQKTIKEKNLYLALEKSTKLIRERFNKLMIQNNYKLSFEQWLILDTVGMESGISQKKIALFLNKEPASISRMVNKLAQNQMIIKTIDESDRKAFQLYLSDKGHEDFKNLKKKIDKEFKEVFTNTYERELNLVISILKRLEKTLIQKSEL